MRTCRKCNVEKELEQFSFSVGKSRQGDIPWRRHMCVECYRLEKRAKKEILRKWFLDFKKTLSCNKCGNSDHRVLDFHHKDSKTKDVEVSRAVNIGASTETILNEIEKCTVLCSNCHRILHYVERNS